MHFQSLLDGGAYGSLRRREHLLHRRAADRDLPGADLPLRRRARLHQQAARAGPSAATARRSRASRSRCSSTRRPTRLGLDPAAHAARATCSRPTRSPPTGCGSARWGSARASRRSSRAAAGSEQATASCRAAGASASRARRYICGAGLPIYWNAMPHTGVQVQARPRRRRRRLLRRDRHRPGQRHGARDVRRRGARRRPRATSASRVGRHRPDARSTSAATSSRVTLMMGNAAIQAAERAREHAREAVAAEARGARRRGSCFAEDRVFDVEDPERGHDASRKAVELAEAQFGTIGTAGSYTPPRHARHATAAPASGPSPAYSLQRGGGRGRRRRGDRRGPRREGLDRARHRPCDQPRSSSIGQVEGGVYMGLGEALMEEMTLPRRTASACTRSRRCSSTRARRRWRCPTVETYLVEDPDPNGPFGAKEVGQGPLLPIMPAVANARLRRASACASTRCRSRPRRCCRRSRPRTSATARARSRTCGSARRCA